MSRTDKEIKRKAKKAKDRAKMESIKRKAKEDSVKGLEGFTYLGALLSGSYKYESGNSDDAIENGAGAARLVISHMIHTRLTLGDKVSTDPNDAGPLADWIGGLVAYACKMVLELFGEGGYRAFRSALDGNLSLIEGNAVANESPEDRDRRKGAMEDAEYRSSLTSQGERGTIIINNFGYGTPDKFVESVSAREEGEQ